MLNEKGFTYTLLILAVLLLIAILAGAYFLGLIKLPSSIAPRSATPVPQPSDASLLKKEYSNPFDQKANYQNPFSSPSSYSNPFNELK